MKHPGGSIVIFFLFAFLGNNYMNTKNRSYLFSSESVTEGHPDKVCDQVSDAILDAHLAQDPKARVACETMAGKDFMVISGEISSRAMVDHIEVAKETLRSIGYTDPSLGFSEKTCDFIEKINQQSSDIAMGVNETTEHEMGAGDQGLMFGYACNETPELLPLPISLAHKLTFKLAELRKNGTLPWVRPDGKSQVTVKYLGHEPVEVTTVIISIQHDEAIDNETIQREIKEKVITPICEKYLTENTAYHINATGRFVIGGPAGDTGVTGRKIIVDTYGGRGGIGGGCFSGKDPSKVDRSGAYIARHIAKNIVAAKIVTKCEVQIAYSIGVAEPVSLYVNTFGTSTVPEEEIEKVVRDIFPLKPAEIIRYLDLQKPMYKATASYGHFGREDVTFPWEKTNKTKELTEKLNLFVPKTK
jgi:S-adenosylmethionine synthetase